MHKENLADQWVVRATQFIPGIRIGRVQVSFLQKTFQRCSHVRFANLQGKKCVYENCDIVLVMIQSLVASKRAYPRALFEETSMLIVDECHRVGSSAFRRAAPMFSAMYRVGLSATPERRDGLTPMLFWHLGHIVFRTERVFEKVFVERLVHDKENGAQMREIKYVFKKRVSTLLLTFRL